jgi:hypothetical protein
MIAAKGQRVYWQKTARARLINYSLIYPKLFGATGNAKDRQNAARTFGSSYNG